MSVINVLLYKL